MKNDLRESAGELSLPQIMNGQLETSTDEDWYRLACRAGTTLSIECFAQPGWSSALPVVALVDAQGNVVSSVNGVQAVGGTSRMQWQPPSDGEWWLRVRDLQHGIRGGPDFIYRLTVQEAAPDFLLSTKVDVINVVQGARAELDVVIERLGGYAGPIELIADGLPEAVFLRGKRDQQSWPSSPPRKLAPLMSRCGSEGQQKSPERSLNVLSGHCIWDMIRMESASSPPMWIMCS